METKQKDVVYVQIDLYKCSGVWKPVWAEQIKDNIYKILEKEAIPSESGWVESQDFLYEPEYEEWEFPPGTMVRCEWFTGERGDVHLRAVEKA